MTALHAPEPTLGTPTSTRRPTRRDSSLGVGARPPLHDDHRREARPREKVGSELRQLHLEPRDSHAHGTTYSTSRLGRRAVRLSSLAVW